MVEGSASVVINRPLGDVFAAISDVTRMGEFSPECTACRWVPPATGPEVGAEFEGDNVAKAGPITLKKWTTTSRVTEYRPDAVFEFSSAGYTTWRFVFEDQGNEDQGGATKVTESFSYPQYTGWQKFLYSTVLNRQKDMVAGMQQTLDRIKTALEA